MLQCGLYNIYAIMTFDMRFLHTYLFQSVKGIFTVYFFLYFSLLKVFLQFIFPSIFQSVKGIFTVCFSLFFSLLKVFLLFIFLYFSVC